MKKRTYTVAITFSVPESQIDSEAIAELFVSSQLEGKIDGLEVIETDSRDDTDEYEDIEQVA